MTLQDMSSFIVIRPTCVVPGVVEKSTGTNMATKTTSNFCI